MKNLPEIMGSQTLTLRALIREYLFVSLFRACAEALSSEDSTRPAARQRADKTIENCWRPPSTGLSTDCARAASTRNCSRSSPALKR
jgi:F0F1-type ATP synthase gamma subunit